MKQLSNVKGVLRGALTARIWTRAVHAGREFQNFHAKQNRAICHALPMSRYIMDLSVFLLKMASTIMCLTMQIENLLLIFSDS